MRVGAGVLCAKVACLGIVAGQETMNPLPESTLNLLLSALVGLFASLVTIPLNAWVTAQLWREEELLQHKLDWIAKKRELVLQHRLEMARFQLKEVREEMKVQADDVAQIRARVVQLEQRVSDG